VTYQTPVAKTQAIPSENFPYILMGESNVTAIFRVGDEARLNQLLSNLGIPDAA
jgi:hypothetical protein